mmetsp:Transcript_52160/g.148706  ORF Transcript_52160/g.148706 Transcript_52160/m.148706 type:complete len:226 (-) Transcript_52160:129-806(-)
MLATEEKLALVASSIWPRICPPATLEVVKVLSLVGAPVMESELSLPMHLAVPPLTLVSSAIVPLVGAPAVELIVAELALIPGARLGPSERVLALAALDPAPVLPNKERAVRKREGARAVLRAAIPLALVDGPVRQRAPALAVRLVVHPGPSVGGAVGVLKGAQALGPAAPQGPRVPPAVGPELAALAVGPLPDPLACVCRAALELARRALLALVLLPHEHVLHRE